MSGYEFRPFRLADSMQAAQGMALNTMRIDEQGRQLRARQGLQEAVAAGTPEAMQGYRAEFPEEAMAYEGKSLALDNARQANEGGKIDKALKRVDYIGRLAGAVSDDASYQRMLSGLREIGLDKELETAPPQFDPTFVKQLQMNALTAKDKLAILKDQWDRDYKERTLAETGRHHRATEANAKEKNSNERDTKARQIDRMVKSGVPREIAAGIVDHTIREVKDPLGLEARYIDLARDVEVGRLDNKGKWIPGPGSATAARGGGAIGDPRSVPPGLPPGSKQIGTSGGKPVYEAPDGKRYVAD